MLSVVAAVLHLGNIEFAQNASDEAVLASAAAQEELDIVAALLQVRTPRLLFATSQLAWGCLCVQLHSCVRSKPHDTASVRILEVSSIF